MASLACVDGAGNNLQDNQVQHFSCIMFKPVTADLCSILQLPMGSLGLAFTSERSLGEQQKAAPGAGGSSLYGHKKDAIHKKQRATRGSYLTNALADFHLFLK